MEKTDLDVLVIGDTAIDHFYEVDRIPKLNNASEVLSSRQFYGGMGANTAVVARSLGLKTGLVSVIGTDAEDYRMYMQNLGINLFLKGIFGDTTRSLFFKEPGSDLISFFYKGVTEKLSDLDPEKDLEITKAVIRDVGCVYMARTYLLLQKKISSMCKGKFLVYNPGYGVFKFDAVPDLFYKILKNTSVLVLNHHELAHLKKIGFESWEKQGPKILIVTKGDRGCSVYTHESEVEVPGYKTSAVDASGAGDAFNAGFIAARLRNYAVCDAAKVANATASFIVEKWGCQTNLPTWEQALKRYEMI